MEENEVLTDNLRCNRTDGRKWRCNRRVMDDKKLCEIHYLQGKHRQHKQKVPQSLKLDRKSNNPKIGPNKHHKTNNKDNRKRKRKPFVGVSEALDETLKKMKLKRGDLQLELIRGFLKRQVEKTKEKDFEKKSEKDLPNGLMAISYLPPPQKLCNVGLYNVKVGVDSGFSLRRCFRSKNIEPLPIVTTQGARKLIRKKRKKCHWCRKSSYRIMIKCSSCRRQYFCVDCIKERNFDKQEFMKGCPVCHKTCSCKACSIIQSKEIHKDFYRDKKKVDKIPQLCYLIYMLLPVLAQINQEQSNEVELEAKIKGKLSSEVHIQQVELGSKKLHCCNNCKTSIVDFHRSCKNCSYNLCLSCCLEFRRGYLCKDIKVSTFKYPNTWKACGSDDKQLSKMKQNWKACDDGSIYCPPIIFGGCGDRTLELRCTIPFGWTKVLEASAEEMLCSYKLQEASNNYSCCSLCQSTDHKARGKNLLQEVSRREDSNDNSLYYPSVKDLHEEKLDHFQMHWGKGQPVIVRNVLKSTLDLSWDPVVMFCTYLEKKNAKSQNDKEAIKTTSCLDWCEVEIVTKQIFMGSLEGEAHANIFRETLKLKGWLASHLFQEHFPVHYAEIIRALPLEEYTNPMSGLLNLALKLPHEMPKSDLGPCIYISYGGPEELMQPDFLTKLCYDPYDVVNILAHTTDVPISKEQLNTIKSSMKRYKARDHMESTRNATDKNIINDVNGKLLLHTKDINESGLHHMIGVPFPNEIAEVSSYPGDPLGGCASSVSDEIMSQANEHISDIDSEDSLLFSGTIQSCSDSDDDNFLGDDIEGSSCDGKKLLADSCGAQWDVFRRQDTPKLLEYLKRHSNEFSPAFFRKHVVHPILDQTFFLDEFHKLRLKEEFNIEPWTFQQHLGEAVIIPAGCPYQIRKLKSCVNVVVEFISPENAAECIKLTDEIRSLPLHHKAREKMVEVKKRTIYGISAAIEEIS